MKGAFAIDSKWYKVVEKAVSLIGLNLLWILFCLPVVTIGAASCALYDTAAKIGDNKEGYVVRNFLQVFRRKWKQASGLWMILFPSGIGLCLNLLFWTWQEGMVPEMMTGMVIMLLVFWFFLTAYGFALTARMETPVRMVLKNAAFLALKHLPQSLYMLFWTGVFLAAGWLWTPVMLAELFAGAAALAAVHAKVLEKIFEEEIN